MRAASGMSRTIDRRRPRKLTSAQKAEVARHPEVRLLRRRQEKMLVSVRETFGPISKQKGTPIYDQYQKASRDYRNMKRRREETLLKDVKARYTREQPVADIQQQLRGLPMAEIDAVKEEDYVFAERIRVIDALFTFATTSPEEECKRRSDAIDALTALCRLQGAQRAYRRKASVRDHKVEDGSMRQSSPEILTLSESIPIECQPTQCIFCLGKEGLPTDKRTKRFCSRGDLKKHLNRCHLQHHPDDQPIECPHPKCQTQLTGRKHIRKHADSVHKTPT